MLPRGWARFLAVFAFAFLAAVGGLAAAKRLLFAPLALAVTTMAALALGVLFFFLLFFFLLFPESSSTEYALSS